jgi:hypothetical protein
MHHHPIVITIEHVDNVPIAKPAAIERLTAGRWIEAGAIEHNKGATVDLAGFNDGAGESKQEAVAVIEAIGHIRDWPQ